MTKNKNEVIIEKTRVSYLGLNILFRELKSLSLKWKLFLVALVILFTLDTLILNYGMNAGHHFEWIWGTSFAEQSDTTGNFENAGWHAGWTHSFYTYWFASKITNGITAFVGVLNVVLIAKRKVTNFFWGILSCIFYGNYAFAAGYTGDALLNIFFYLPMSFVGWHFWFKNFNKKDDVVKVNIFRWFYWIALAAFLAAITAAWYYVIPVVDEALRIALFNDHGGYYYASEFAPHFLDAFTNALGVASTFLMYGRFGQEFMLYLVKDTISVFMWSGIFHSDILSFDFSMIICMAAYAISGGAGLWVWMDATPTGRKVKTALPFIKTNYAK